MPTSVDADGAWSLQLLNNALQGRYLIGSIFQAANPVSSSVQAMNTWRSGVVVTSSYLTDLRDLRVSASASPSMTLPVNAGSWVVHRPSQGPYLGWSSIVRNVVLDNGDPTNPRIDRVVARVYDSGVGDSLLKARIEVVPGAPAPSPAVPGVPVGAIPLARVAVAANATQITNANITDERIATGVQGALRPMLPGENVSDTGYVYGEMRIRTRTDIAQELMEFWGKDGAWHRLNPVWPKALLINNGTQTIANTADSDVAWTSAPINDSPGGNPMWSASGPNTRMTIREDGVYIFGSEIRYIANSTGRRTMTITKNNTGTPTNASAMGHDQSVGNVTLSANTLKASNIDRFANGDILRVSTWQSSGGNLNLSGNAIEGAMRFWAYKIAD